MCEKCLELTAAFQSAWPDHSIGMPLTHPTAPARAIVAPSMEDLFGLRKLCGSDSAVIDYFANWYQMEADAIAPTIQSWLANCPVVPPPSRQRSAPAVSSDVATAAAMRNPRAAANRPPEILPIKTPPASAPVHSAPSIAAALSAANHRLSASAAATRRARRARLLPCLTPWLTLTLAVQCHVSDHSTRVNRKPLSTVQQESIHTAGSFRPKLLVPPSVPENMQVLTSTVPKALLTDVVLNGKGGLGSGAEAEASALARYNARYALNGGGKLAPTSALLATGIKNGPSGWNPSF